MLFVGRAYEQNASLLVDEERAGGYAWGRDGRLLLRFGHVGSVGRASRCRVRMQTRCARGRDRRACRCGSPVDGALRGSGDGRRRTVAVTIPAYAPSVG